MRTKLFLLSLSAAVLFTACNRDNAIQPPLTTHFQKIGESEVGGTSLELFALTDLHTGFNKIFLRLTNNSTNKTVTEAHLTVMASSTVNSTSVIAPVEPVASVIPHNDFFECAVVFQNPSVGQNKDWNIEIDLHNQDSGEETHIVVPVHVEEAHCCASFIGSDNQEYVLSMSDMKSFVVGLNSIDVTLHRLDSSGLFFQTVEDAEIHVVPDMPDMGHSSPGNIDPTLATRGHYTGKLNFTMSGAWRITTSVSRGGIEIGKVELMSTIL